jgi:hypothetical protein
MLRTTTRLLLLAALATLALGGTAQAKQIQQYFYSGELFEAGGSDPQAIAVDGVNQKILVVGKGDDQGLKISKFQLNGDPAGFSGRSDATSFHTGEKLEGSAPVVAIAIDESGTSSNGNFYVTSNGVNDLVRGYAADGTPLPGFPVSIPGVCGLTVAPDGHVWVASRELGAYGELTAGGNPTGRILTVGAKEGSCQIAIDSAGNFYVAKGLHVAKYDSSIHFVGNLGAGDYTGFGGRSTPLLSFDRANDTLFELSAAGSFAENSLVTQVDSAGNPITTFGGPDPAHFSYEGLGKNARDLAVDPQTHKVYVLKEGEVNVFSRDPSTVTVPTSSATGVKDLTGASATLTGTVDPDGIDTTDCHFEWGTSVESFGVVYTETVPCSEGNVFAGGSGENVVTASIGGLKKGSVYHFRLSAENANGIAGVSKDSEFTASDPPLLSGESTGKITTDTARIGFGVNTNGADSTYHVEIGTDTNYGASFPVPDPTAAATRPIGVRGEEIEVILEPQAKSQEVSGLQPGTLYHYRVVAENPAGVVEGDDHTFRTFALPGTIGDSCPNAQARQQTSASGLLDCRAYELVSAADTGGYDVRSDLSPGVRALVTSPSASDTALYSMRSGTIPGVAGHPTNRGADPYLATRGANGWSTRYVGLPSDNPFATGPFASPLSGFDSALGTFAFGGAEICDPCFEDGSTDAPLRLANGSLVKGMAGSMDPGPADPAGTVRKPLSTDGSHFLFGTTAQFESGANSNGTDATIYSRDLKAGTTEVISTDETGTAIANADGVAALDVSKDGSRAVIGERLSTDSAGNDYYHLYLHIAGTAESVDLMPGATEGALFDGMTADGSKAFFTSSEPLAVGESDESADIYEVEVPGPGVVTPELISGGSEGTGDVDICSPPGDPNNWNAASGEGKCNALAFAGGAGVASAAGDFYFLSPEKLDGSSNGIQDQPNLYLVESGTTTPHFVATIDSSAVKPPPDPPTRPVVTTEFGGEHNAPQALTVDQSNGDVYVTEGSGKLSRYTAAGAPDNFTEGPGEGTNAITGLSFVESAPEVAVDRSGGILDGAIYVTNYPNVSIFSQSGKSLGQLSGFGEVCGVAVDQSDGNVYVGDCFGKVWRFAPTSATEPIANANYEVTGISAGMEAAAVAADDGNVYASSWPSGPAKQFSSSQFEAGFPGVSGDQVDANATALSTDPGTHELYVDEGNRVAVFNPAREQLATLGSGFVNSRGVAVNASSHHVFVAGGGAITEFGYQVPPYEPIDNPAVVHAVKQAGTYDSSDFEVTPDGSYAAFASGMPIDGYDSAGHYEVFRYAPGDSPRCVSCAFTTSLPQSDAVLTPYGLSLLSDGRVFFTTGEQLTLRDTNEAKDAYEWSSGKQELISTGTAPTDSELLSVSSDGTDAFFFTRQKLVPEDDNGANIRLYTAREQGGFAFGPPQFSCAASDECHGASSAPAPPLAAGTTAGTPGQFTEEAKAKCRKGKVKRRGKCVSRKQHKRHNHKRAAKTTRGGGK